MKKKAEAKEKDQKNRKLNKIRNLIQYIAIWAFFFWI